LLFADVVKPNVTSLFFSAAEVDAIEFSWPVSEQSEVIHRYECQNGPSECRAAR